MRRKPTIFFLIRRPWRLGMILALLLLLISGALKITNVFANHLKDKIIVIDAGHGGQDPGAQFHGLKEKDINLDITLRLQKALEIKGCKVILTRDADKDFFAPKLVTGRMAKRIELNQRIDIATQNNADLFISIHTNSYPQGSSYGMETYYHLNSAPGKALADRIQNRLVAIQPDNKRKAKAGDYYLINQTKMPAVIVEVGFLSNPRERSLLQKAQYKDSVAQAIAKGIEDYFNDFPSGHAVLNQMVTTKPSTAQIALVIDDFGINNPGTQAMMDLGVPITAAVMPNLMFSNQEAETLHQKGYEVILHMPMEAKNAKPEWLGPGALRTGLSSEELRSRLEQSLASVPFAVGISNHMGSKGSEDPKIVTTVVNVAKEHNLFILDSKTSEATILAEKAQNEGLYSSMRDVFLDNSADINSIKKQIRLLMEKAKTNGKAIGIGHVGPQGPSTAQAIREMLPELESQGIQIVPLSELLQTKKVEP